MGKSLSSLTPELTDLVESQPVFFVATAPLSAEGHVNVSPKGLDTLRVLSPDQVAYLDLTGSGNETAAHVAENSRITLMFCSFSGPPRIVRVYGSGRVVLPGSDDWTDLIGRFREYPGARQIIEVRIERVQMSCGYGVPVMEYVAEREALPKWAESKGEAAMAEYRRTKNATSIDGLPTPAAEP